MDDLHERTRAALIILSNEYRALGVCDRARVAADAVAAYCEDGCEPGRYLARIGAGNLGSYAACLKAQAAS